VGTASLSTYGRRIVEQARRIGKSPAFLYRWIHNGGLPASLVGNTWYVKDEDIDMFVHQRTAARLGKPAPVAKKSHDAADAALDAAGW
jgi:excisionase family DNA binding protein